jgi:hypothetical protein
LFAEASWADVIKQLNLAAFATRKLLSSDKYMPINCQLRG